MEGELLTVLDEQRNVLGVASRYDVHTKGYWHDAFHCWFVTNENGVDYVYVQLRSERKTSYPNLLDITAAGHLVADERVQDGVREIEEEIGIVVPFEELIPLGILQYCIVKDELIDKEFAHVFLYRSAHALKDFTLQFEEVSGMMKMKFEDFEDLWLGKKDEVCMQGFEMKAKRKIEVEKYVGREQFVPHPDTFYHTVIERIRQQIK